MSEQQFQEGEIVRYVVEGPIFALLQAEDGVGVALRTHPGECMVISGRNLKFIQRGPDPRDAEIEQLRRKVAAFEEWINDPDILAARACNIRIGLALAKREQQDGGESRG